MFGVIILAIPLHNLSIEKKKEGGGSDMNRWCELDTNLLGEIMGRLCVADQARFRAVCTKWLAVRPITNSKPLPWYFVIDRSLPAVSRRLEIRVYEALSPPNLASVDNICLARLGIPSPQCYYDVSVFIKHNWLFIGFGWPGSSIWRRRCYILFSVFTKKIITLPKLGYQSSCKFMRTFTTEPDSPDCVFFLLYTENAGKILVVTYHNGDKDWFAREVDIVVDFLPCVCYPVYIRGILYIVSPYGQLASFNVVDGEFKLESLSVDELFRLNYTSSRMYTVFELNGELMLLYFGCFNKYDTPLGKPCIKMYDWSNKVWIPVSTLGDNALFLSDKFVQVTTVNRQEMNINGVLSNKLYLFSDCGCLIYSIEDGELVEFKPTNSNLLEDGGCNLPEYKYNRDFSFPDATKAVFWLDPPRFTTETILVNH